MLTARRHVGNRIYAHDRTMPQCYCICTSLTPAQPQLPFPVAPKLCTRTHRLQSRAHITTVYVYGIYTPSPAPSPFQHIPEKTPFVSALSCILPSLIPFPFPFFASHTLIPILPFFLSLSPFSCTPQSHLPRTPALTTSHQNLHPAHFSTILLVSPIF